MPQTLKESRELLQDFEFNKLFVQKLGWDNPSSHKTVSLEIEGETYSRKAIAQLNGVVVYEIIADSGNIPNSAERLTIYREIVQISAENLLIFIDKNRTKCLWYWVKREGTKLYPRDHVYVKREPCDLLLSKVTALKVDLEELETLSVIDVAQRLQAGLDVERVTKKFFEEFKQQHVEFLSVIRGIDKETDRRWYTSVLLNRLMFVYFLQRKGFIDSGKMLYLQEKLAESKQRGTDLFYSQFLKTLFFDGFAKPLDLREEGVKELIGDVKYLNGGLFLEHPIEQNHRNIAIPDAAFEKIFKLFAAYSWNLDDTVGGKENEINPAVLGYIFEKYINQKAFGAYYTRPEITEYLCDRTINKLILDRVNQSLNSSNSSSPLTKEESPSSSPLTNVESPSSSPLSKGGRGGSSPHFETITELLTNLDANLCRRLLTEILPNLTLLDPACGSGAFLVAAMKTLIYIYSTVIGTSKFLNDHHLNNDLKKIEKEHTSLNYYIKKRIISDNLYGVDIMPEAVEIAKLRLFLALVSAAQKVNDLEPLPNIDFNIMAGNSLIGLLRVDDAEYEGSGTQLNLFHKTYRQVLEEKNRLISIYRHATTYSQNLQSLRDEIAEKKAPAIENLNKILLEDFKELKIKFEQAQISGKPIKRTLTLADIEALKPFHWGYEFDEILHQRGGFDAIITNPPWEVFQTNEKEFFQVYVTSIRKNKLPIEEWEAQREELLKQDEIKKAWCVYESSFPHQLAYFKRASQYVNQTTVIDGKTVGNKPNLYSIFTEQCFNLLCVGGECGIVLPSSIYSDLGTKQLREMLFSKTQVTGLFGFENRKTVFEGVDSRFKFVVFTFEKGKFTTTFPATFMRQDVQELLHFPGNDSLKISVDLVRRLSPDSLSLIEFNSKKDLDIAAKLLNFPLLSDTNSGWGIELYGEELNMTRSSSYFKTSPTNFPVYEGRMIWYFDHNYSEARYWIKEIELKNIFLNKRIKRIEALEKVPEDMKNDYEAYRIAIRKIARNTDTRTLIATIIPPYAFAGNSLSVNFPFCHTHNRYNDLRISNVELLILVALLNSLVSDYVLRSRMNTNLNLFYLYQLPVPRLHPGDHFFTDIVQRAAKLICTAPEFDELAQEVGLNSHREGVTDETERAQLRAELDGIIAHLYGLTEAEFAYILTTFPIVPEAVKQAALAAYRTFAASPGDPP
ncbi:MULTISPECIES: Eco57I restriction-modification methylase domain-containing protein [unclassified Microcoleus]|uniref:Eco57I restriction-modification methylase domain-containing protein n=1 Tax=unclassified Microcoleus TaxID=2642155 RepID=UPI002FD268AC